MQRIRWNWVVSGLVGAFVLTMLLTLASQVAVAAKGGGGGGGCNRGDIVCPGNYDPVICSDGVTYQNSCVAFRNCAKRCESTGGGGPIP